MAANIQDKAIQPVDDFLQGRNEKVPERRQKLLREAARSFGDRMRAGPQVRAFKSVPLVRAPYPAHYGFLDVPRWQFPFIHILNRMFIVQVDTPAGMRTLLLSPTWVEGSRATPFFARLEQRMGPLRGLGRRLMAPAYNTVEQAVADAGLQPEDIDYISYDHMHTQDVRHWLGGEGHEAYFPNARLLIMREEWESCQGLIAPQKEWYVEAGMRGVPEDRVVILDQDVTVGDGLALIKTPGHTVGNHSFVVNTPDGVYTISENGVGPDCYAPEHSRIKAFRRYYEDTGKEVVLNGNTLEGGLDQYISMIMEKEMAGPSPVDPAFPNVYNSSEFTAYSLFPGHRPSLTVGEKAFGTIERPAQRKRKAA